MLCDRRLSTSRFTTSLVYMYIGAAAAGEPPVAVDPTVEPSPLYSAVPLADLRVAASSTGNLQVSAVGMMPPGNASTAVQPAAANVTLPMA